MGINAFCAIVLFLTKILYLVAKLYHFISQRRIIKKKHVMPIIQSQRLGYKIFANRVDERHDRIEHQFFAGFGVVILKSCSNLKLRLKFKYTHTILKIKKTEGALLLKPCKGAHFPIPMSFLLLRIENHLSIMIV